MRFIESFPEARNPRGPRSWRAPPPGTPKRATGRALETEVEQAPARDLAQSSPRLTGKLFYLGVHPSRFLDRAPRSTASWSLSFRDVRIIKELGYHFFSRVFVAEWFQRSRRFRSAFGSDFRRETARTFSRSFRVGVFPAPMLTRSRARHDGNSPWHRGGGAGAARMQWYVLFNINLTGATVISLSCRILFCSSVFRARRDGL